MLQTGLQAPGILPGRATTFLAFTDKGVTGVDAGSAVPTWLSDWRLKLALGSWQLYQELWMELSGAAAACYTK